MLIIKLFLNMNLKYILVEYKAEATAHNEVAEKAPI